MIRKLHKKIVRQAHHRQGFTLLEALVAISILMVAVAAPITISQKGLSSAVYSKDQMIAAYLAQDAIEYIKNMRDEVAINNDFDWTNLWDPDYLGDCVDDSGCQIDTVNEQVTSYESGKYLYKDSNNFYQYETIGNQATKFTRTINVTLVDLDDDPDTDRFDEALVAVTVNWGTEKDQLVVQTLIYNY